MGSGKIIGIDVDIAAALADELGLKLSVVDVGSDPAGALANGTVDVVLGIDDSASDGDFWRSASYLPTGIALFALTPTRAFPPRIPVPPSPPKFPRRAPGPSPTGSASPASRPPTA